MTETTEPQEAQAGEDAVGRVRLAFDTALNRLREEKELRDGLSLVAAAGPTLWLASDETTRLERLTRQDDGSFADHAAFPLADYLDLPGGADVEVDIEGLSFDGRYLWVVGSHSLKRDEPKKKDHARKAIRRLGQTSRDANRYLLARIPLRDQDGLPAPARKSGKRAAAQLRGDGKGNDLTHALRKDPHVGPFLSIPSKDNGFDIEGLSVVGGRVFLGLRGPVLRGWAIVVEVHVRRGRRGELRLKKIGPKGQRRYRKHFLQLNGLGIRELSHEGDDLLLLAGPTMGLDGPVEVLRWRGGAASKQESVVRYEQLEKVTPIAYGEGDEAGQDHAEGMTLLPGDGGDVADRLLVVYDSPCDARKGDRATVFADLFDLP